MLPVHRFLHSGSKTFCIQQVRAATALDLAGGMFTRREVTDMHHPCGTLTSSYVCLGVSIFVGVVTNAGTVVRTAATIVKGVG